MSAILLILKLWSLFTVASLVPAVSPARSPSALIQGKYFTRTFTTHLKNTPPQTTNTTNNTHLSQRRPNPPTHTHTHMCGHTRVNSSYGRTHRFTRWERLEYLCCLFLFSAGHLYASGGLRLWKSIHCSSAGPGMGGEGAQTEALLQEWDLCLVSWACGYGF